MGFYIYIGGTAAHTAMAAGVTDKDTYKDQ